MTKPVVCVIGTGGTIASRFDPALGGHVSAASPEELVGAVPRLDEIAQIEVLSHSNINSARKSAPSAMVTPNHRRTPSGCSMRAATTARWTVTLDVSSRTVPIAPAHSSTCAPSGGQGPSLPARSVKYAPNRLPKNSSSELIQTTAPMTTGAGGSRRTAAVVTLACCPACHRAIPPSRRDPGG